jgi:polyhydroxybutyrate depolymerase
MSKLVYLPNWQSALALLFVLFWAAPPHAQNKQKGKTPPDDLQKREWTVDGAKRQALVHIPPQAKTKASALVFVYHGHGGDMGEAAEEFAIHRHWPAAIVVYMQGLKTPQGNDPQGKLTGWQYQPGDQRDRDVHFFDTVLADLSGSLKVDSKRVFAAGFSNGGAFSIVLWSERRDKLAATASVCMRVFDNMLPKLAPNPFLMVAGKDDDLQKFGMMEGSLKKVVELNKCEDGKPWIQKGCTLYPSQDGKPVLFMVHKSGHEVPRAAQTVIVDFFNEIQPGKGRSQVVGDWEMNQPTVGRAKLQITEKAGKLEVQELGNGNAKGTKTVYRDGLLVINWEVNADLRGYWVLQLNQDHTKGKGKTVFTHFKNFEPGEPRQIDGQNVRVVEGVTIERIGEKKR